MQNITQHQKIIQKHFLNVADVYDDCRTLDDAPVKYLTDIVSTDAHTICSLGCGTGRYLIELIKAFKSAGNHVNGAHGVDTSSTMLEIAESKTDGLKPAINWILGLASGTGLLDCSISLATAFNSIHHFPIKETLSEVKRILQPKGLFAIYTRVLEQESEHIWGRFFPGYIDYSTVFTREFMSNFHKYDKGWQLIEVQDFTYKRRASLPQICEQTRNRHYSTLARYSEHEFESAYGEFVKNIKKNYLDLDNIEYPSSNTLFIYQYS